MPVTASGFYDRRQTALETYRLLPEVYKTKYSQLILLHIIAADSFMLATGTPDVHLPRDDVHDVLPLGATEMAHQSLSTATYFMCLAAHQILAEYVTLFSNALVYLSRETRAEELEGWKKLESHFSTQLERCLNNDMIFHDEIDVLARNELKSVLAAIDSIESKHRRVLEMLRGKSSAGLSRRSAFELLVFLLGAGLTFLYLRSIKN